MFQMMCFSPETYLQQASFSPLGSYSLHLSAHLLVLVFTGNVIPCFSPREDLNHPEPKFWYHTQGIELELCPKCKAGDRKQCSGLWTASNPLHCAAPTSSHRLWLACSSTGKVSWLFTGKIKILSLLKLIFAHWKVHLNVLFESWNWLATLEKSEPENRLQRDQSTCCLGTQGLQHPLE